jgi:putative transposase
MVTILFALVSLLSFRFRSRASLELELVDIATSGDRLAPATPSPTSAPFRRPAPVDLVLPSATAGPRNLGTRQTGDCGQWHREGLRIYWRWRSRSPGRPKTSDEIRDLIRQMSLDNPLWGAPRVHGELLCLLKTRKCRRYHRFGIVVVAYPVWSK